MRWDICLLIPCENFSLAHDLFCLFPQADTCIQSPGGQRRLQTSSEVVTVHSSEQHAAEHHGNQLCVGQHGQFKPSLRGQLPAAQGGAEQRGGEPHRAVQHQQRIHCCHHTRCPIIRKHITARQQAVTVMWCLLPHTVCWLNPVKLSLSSPSEPLLVTTAITNVQIFTSWTNHKQTQWITWRKLQDGLKKTETSVRRIAFWLQSVFGV